MTAYRCFEVEGKNIATPTVADVSIAATSITALVVGEEGRGRVRAIIPVGGVTPQSCPRRGQNFGSLDVTGGWGSPSKFKCVRCGHTSIEITDENRYTTLHPDAGFVGYAPVERVCPTTTRSGKPKLDVSTETPTEDSALVVFRTQIGFRGSNSHRVEGEPALDHNGKPLTVEGKPVWMPFDTSGRVQVLARGTIAQGGAGGMGSGQQYVVILPRNQIVRVGLGGRLYGAPNAYYYRFDGLKLEVLTQQERDVADLW